MPKRIKHGVSSKQSYKHHHKTAKRLAIKKAMLAKKPGRKNK